MMSKPITRFCAVASLLAALAGCNSAHTSRSLVLADQPAAAPVATQVTVHEDQIKSDLYFLASDRLEGRGVGTAGLDIAADFIASRFESLGLRPLPGLNGYFQPFEITSAQSIDPATSLTLADHACKLDAEFTALSSSPEKSFSGPLVFAGYSVTNRDRHYDDYADIDVKGKVVLALRFEPHDDKGQSRWGTNGGWTPSAYLESKARAAAEHGAAALILINPPNHNSMSDDPLIEFARQYTGTLAIPVLQVKRNVADQLLRQAGAPSLSELQSKIDQSEKPASIDLNGAAAKGGVAIKRTRKTVRNVVACIPGSGPHADEYVVIGAHYDHLGWGGAYSLANMPLLQRQPGVTEPGNPHAAPATTQAHSALPTTRAIHHGADDNASGTVAVLELARLFAHRAAKEPPQRTLVFCAFTGEEMGLLGSGHFVNHSPIDLKKSVAMLNLDMVGRIRKELLYVGGGGTAAPLHSILKKADLDSPLEFKNFGEGGLGPSDHMSFAQKKVPVLFLFSGTHEDYHRPTDTPDKINYDGIAQVVQMSVELIDDLAAMPKSQYVDAADKSTMMNPSLVGGDGQRRASLGVIPEYGGEEDGKGVRISGTSTGTPADKAGLRAGDVLLKLGDQPTSTLMELSTALASHKPGDKVKLIYKRGDKELSADITLGERK
jgi:hypothetical protein